MGSSYSLSQTNQQDNKMTVEAAELAIAAEGIYSPGGAVTEVSSNSHLWQTWEDVEFNDFTPELLDFTTNLFEYSLDTQEQAIEAARASAEPLIEAAAAQEDPLTPEMTEDNIWPLVIVAAVVVVGIFARK